MTALRTGLSAKMFVKFASKLAPARIEISNKESGINEIPAHFCSWSGKFRLS